ncbi:T9SS type A sorting domain-containing protein [uncultured Winogradskyella sp.]|uniref:T9SS type A sorting domain-containing protein n=1 Tax=uncultured Winogradskyella sp. TaxID=395353 RepID=UPI002609C7B7|nr:T9SS type A sorting domain-containing protein [uncultured Winogradskyella sp.]
MKAKLQTKFFLLFLFTVLISHAQQVSTLPAYESFDYDIGTQLIADDATIGLGFWSTTGPRAGDVIVASSPTWSTITGIDLPQGNAIEFAGSGLKPEFLFTPQLDSDDTTYTSCLIKVTDFSSINASASRFFGLGKLNSGGTVSGATHVFVRIDASGNGYNLGFNASNSSTGVTWDSTVFVADQEVMLVLYHDNTNSATDSKIWINPVVNGTEPTPTWVGGPRNLTVDRIQIYQHSSTNTPAMILDELRVGETWGDATKPSILGVSDLESSSELRIYPNPVTSARELFIESSNEDKKEVNIYNLLGQEVLQKSIVSESINLTDLASGTYIIKITENNTTTTKKLVLQ